MKLYPIILIFLTCSIFAAAAINYDYVKILEDPRKIPIWLDTIAGEDQSKKHRFYNPSIHGSILIIHWSVDGHDPHDTYQISGVKGYHSLERILTFVDQYYEAS